MRIRITQTKNRASVLLVALCLAWIIGIALVSYLTLVMNQNRTTYHSLTWNTCIPVLEAGIEDALSQLNYNSGQGLANANNNGWVLASGTYSKTNSVDTDGSYYEVMIDPNAAGTPPTPIIISKGYVPAPANTGTPMGGGTAFGMILGTVGSSTRAMISRTVNIATGFNELHCWKRRKAC